MTDRQTEIRGRVRGLASVLAGLAGIVALTAAVNPAMAEEPAEFYANKQVTLVVASGPGGSHSTYSLLIAPHLQANIPGNPTVVVQHMPGAGGTKAANYLYNTAPKNGTYIGILLADTPLTARLRTTGVKYNPGEFHYLGAAENVHHGLVVRKRAGAASLEEAKAREVVLGSSGKGSQTYIVPTLINAFIGTKFKPVTGYPGLGGILLAIDRGEADGYHATISSIKLVRPEWARRDLVHVLAVTAMDRSPDYPDAPLLLDFIKKPLDRQAIELISGNGHIGRAWLTTPEVPSDRLAALRTAMEKTVFDPAVIAEAKKRGMTWDSMRWEIPQKQAQAIAAADQTVIDHMRKTLGVQ